MVHGQPGQTVLETPISKIIQAKWTGGVTQAVGCLLCKGKALSSNPSPTKKTKATRDVACIDEGENNERTNKNQ
jgi:hypothetical protein